MQTRVGSTTCKRKQIRMHKREQLCISENKNTQAKTTTQMGASAMKKKHNLQITNFTKQSRKRKQELKITQNVKKIKKIFKILKKKRAFESGREQRII